MSKITKPLRIILLISALGVAFVAAQVVRGLGGTAQDRTAAGTDADKNGIRDDIDALIAREFQASPAQTIYAQRLARVLQIQAKTKNLTREEARKSIASEILNITCLRQNTFYELRSKVTSRLASATFNSLERMVNGENFGYTAGADSYVSPKDDECKI